jgi:DNA-binding NarL/FixJ family response regulator
VIISVHEDSEYVLRAIQHGVIGYIPKSANAQEIKHALSRVMSGEVAFPRDILARTLAEPAASAVVTATDRDSNFGLTRREAEIMTMLGDGAPVSDIADALGITRQTVRVHLANAIKKTGLKSREAAVRFAMENAAMLRSIADRP